jgi:hypothetical protein
MPKDRKRNIQSYQLEGGHLNEFEYQKNQSEMAEESELPSTDETDKASLPQAKRLAKIATEAHRKVEKRKQRGLVKAGHPKSIAAGKRPAKKLARKPAKKTTTRAGTKRRANTKSNHQRRAANR